jgi:hypothetical protein
MERGPIAVLLVAWENQYISVHIASKCVKTIWPAVDSQTCGEIRHIVYWQRLICTTRH